jgi:hypothetical protein
MRKEDGEMPRRKSEFKTATTDAHEASVGLQTGTKAWANRSKKLLLFLAPRLASILGMCSVLTCAGCPVPREKATQHDRVRRRGRRAVCSRLI